MNAAQPRRRQGRLLRVTAWLEVRPGPSRGPYLGHCVGDSKAGKIVKDLRLHHCHAPNRSAPYPTGMTPRSVAPATPPSGAGSLQTRAAVGDRDPRQETQTSSRMSELEPRQIDRRNGVCMVAQECPPSLRRRSSPPDHVFGDGQLRDPEAKLQQFAMDARSAPQLFSMLIRLVS